MALVTQISDYLPMLMPDLPGAQTNMVTLELKKALRQFCMDTEIWAEDLEPIDLVDGTTKYALVPSYDAAVHRIFSVGKDKNYWEPYRYVLLQDDTLSEFVILLTNDPKENVTDGMEINVILRPFLKSDEVPEFLFDRWADPIIALAKSNLMLQPKKPYTSPQMAIKYLNDYKMGKADAKREKYVKGIQSNITYVPRRIL